MSRCNRKTPLYRILLVACITNLGSCDEGARDDETDDSGEAGRSGADHGDPTDRSGGRSSPYERERDSSDCPDPCIREDQVDLSSVQIETKLKLRRIAYPTGGFLKGRNDFFGWPVAAADGDLLVMMFHRKPQHYGNRHPNDSSTTTMATMRSTDYGKTWSKPLDLNKVIDTKTRDVRLRFGNALKLLDNGNFLALTKRGVFISEDEAKTWRHIPGAFGGSQLRQPTNNGPNMVELRDYGIVTLGHLVDGVKHPNGTPRLKSDMWVRYSRDQGRTWQEFRVDMNDDFKPAEPSIIEYEGKILGIGRNHSSSALKSGKWRYMQFVLDLKKKKYSFQHTNMVATNAGTKFYGPWAQDTAAIIYNYYTKKIEVAVTNRTGGAPKSSDRRNMVLNLYSIDPEDFLSGKSKWKHEGVLARAAGVMSDATADGMHPGGSVIDERYQHLFIYWGKPDGPSGIYLIKRSLDTKEVFKKFKPVILGNLR